jgi:hypothetical protein
VRLRLDGLGDVGHDDVADLAVVLPVVLAVVLSVVLTVVLALALTLALTLTLALGRLTLALALVRALALALGLTLALALGRLTLTLALVALLGERSAEAADTGDADDYCNDVPQGPPAQAMHIAPFPRLAENTNLYGLSPPVKVTLYS